MSKKFSLRDVLNLLPSKFSIYIRRAFGGNLYFEGFVEDVPNDADYLNFQVGQISGVSLYKYLGQTLRLEKGHPIEHLDISLYDVWVDDEEGK